MTDHAHRFAGWPPHATGFVYALFVFIGPAMVGGGWIAWTLSAASLVVFAALYAQLLSRGRSVARGVAQLAAMAAMGLLLMPFNIGAATYVVYVAALVPVVVEPRRALVVFVVLAAAVLAEMPLIQLNERLIIVSWIVALIFIVGIGNLFVGDRLRQAAIVRRAREEVEEMAKVAERERIARDLHDILGHTLSVIALKSELASKLADRDPGRATQEIREVERISREALAEVRAAVEGYRSRGLAGELISARRALGSAGVRLDAELDPVPLSPRQETALALALREAVTNVARHAQASVCRVTLAARDRHLLMTIDDDGVGGPLVEGHGLAGMRERVAAAGGTLELDGSGGLTVRVSFPQGSAGA